MEKDYSNQNNSPKLYLGVLIIAIIIVWVINLFVGLNHPNNSSDSLGDSFGMVNSLISGISLVLVYYAVRLQMKELSETKIEFQKQNTTLLKQQFETTFFNMTKQLQEIVNEIEVQSQEINSSGHYTQVIKGNNYLRNVCNEITLQLTNPDKMLSMDGFYKLTKHIKSNVDIEYIYKNGFIDEDIRKYIDTCYEFVFQKHKYNLAHFFRYFYNIIKFILESGITNKQLYFQILRAQLSSPQLALIFYNGISSISYTKGGVPNFRSNIDEYNILQNLDDEYLPNWKVAKIFYPITKFKFLIVK